MASTATLTSLAMLKVNRDLRDIDYIDYLRPFVVESLRVHHPDPVNDQEITDALRSDFGLRVPRRGVHVVLGRLAKHGMLQRRDGLFHIQGDLPDQGIATRRADAHRRIDVLLTQLAEYVKATFNLNWSTDECGEVVKAYLADFGIECLRTYIHHTALPDVPKKSRQEIRVVHSFVRDAHRKSVEQFDNFIVVVQGHMLANALMCPDLQSLQQRFDRLVFYLDTPFVLRLLDLGASADTAAARELISLIRSLRGRLAIFTHTLDEIDRVLRSAETQFNRPGNVSLIVRELKQRGKSASDLTLVRSQLTDQLRQNAIQIRNAPPRVVEYQIDEHVLTDAINDEISYHNPQARNHDIDCIQSVFTLRRGTRPSRLEDANAVFVTTNSALARTAFAFGRKFEHSREVSAVITDFSLANVAWLKAPLGAPDLPEREVLAACYAALQPPLELWNKYLNEIDKLKQTGQITERDHEFLRHESLARDELMNLTCGETKALTGETVPEILNRIKGDILAEEQAKSARLTEELVELRNQKVTLQKRLYWISERTGQWGAVLIAALVVLLGAVSSGLIPSDWLNYLGGSRIAAALAMALIAGGALVGFGNLLFGVSIVGMYTSARRHIGGGAFWLLCRVFAVDPKR
jgi:hypothetical protein